MSVDPAVHAADAAAKIALPSLLAKEVCKDVLGFGFDPADHLQLIEQVVLPELLDFTRQSFISISAPPRHGKSVFILFIAAWYLMMFPNKRVIYVSYGDDFSVLGGKIVKTVIERHGPRLFDVHVTRNAPSADWTLTSSPLSGMISVGIGSRITGRGGDLIIVDDLIKNATEARSSTTKRGHVYEYDETLRPRLEPGGTIIIIATRWAEDDLPGTIRTRATADGYKGDPWRFLELPAIAEMPEEELDRAFQELEQHLAEKVVEEWTDELGRHQGEALWPRRYTAESLQLIQGSIDPLSWAALYQQRPTVREGGMFPIGAWGYYDPDTPPVIIQRCWIWDTAGTKDGGDFSVGLLLGLTDERKIAVLDHQRFQGDGAEVDKRVSEGAWRTGASVAVLIEQERAGSGKLVISHFERLLPGYRVLGVRPEGDKEERAGPTSSLVISGGVLLPKGAAWIKAWHAEFKVFPRGRKDDQVDALVHGVSHLMGAGVTTTWSAETSDVDLDQALADLELLNSMGIFASNPLARLQR